MNRKYYIKKLILLYIKYITTFNKDEKMLYLHNIDYLISFVNYSEFHNLHIPGFFYYLGDYNLKANDRMMKYESDTYKSIIETMPLYKEYIKLNDGITELSDNPDIYKKEFQEKVELEKSKDLAGDFFMHFDTDLYLYYNNLRNNNLIIKPKSFDNNAIDGCTMFVSKNKINPFIVEYCNCFLDAVVIVHETMHSYLINKILYNISYDEYSRYLINNIDEVGPIFMEMLFLDYIDNKGLYKEDVRIMKYENFDDYCYFYTSLEDSLNEYLYGPREDAEYEAPAFDFVEKEGLGYLYAFMFYKRYLENGNKNILYSFYNDAKYLTKKELLEKYKLTANNLEDLESLKEYIRR